MATVDLSLYRQLEALPETMIGEILRGKLETSPRPYPKHAYVIGLLQRRLGDPFEQDRDGHGGWWLLSEPEIHLDAQVLVPDVAGWRRPSLPKVPDTAAIHVTPDWVCEVISPSSGRRDRVVKRAIYGEKGVPYLWFVDPATRTLEVLRLTADGWLIDASFADDDFAHAKPFDAIGLPLADLWLD